MSRRTSSSPKPWPQFEVRTTFLRVPVLDWAAVKHGYKTEFRATGRAVTQPWNLQLPTPVVGYKVSNQRDDHESTMLVLEESWTEPLLAISPESIRREGFADMTGFRNYWMQRTKRRFRPLTEVRVYRVRPFADDDVVAMGNQLLTKLYGEHL